VTATCEYPSCTEAATVRVVVELGRISIRRHLCSRHAERAKQIAKEAGGFAYRVVPI
jgi:hypothetical protein